MQQNRLRVKKAKGSFPLEVSRLDVLKKGLEHVSRIFQGPSQYEALCLEPFSDSAIFRQEKADATIPVPQIGARLFSYVHRAEASKLSDNTMECYSVSHALAHV